MSVEYTPGSYSKVVDNPVKTKRRSEHPVIDGGSVIQELGYIERKSYRFFWITTEQLQAEIEALESEAADGWILSSEVSRTPIHEALDLYNATIAMHRYIST